MRSMLIGYARVATLEQPLDLQQDALRDAGCERIFTDTVSGANNERPGLTAALSACRAGDILVVWKCDRLGRSLAHLVETVQAFAARGIGLRSLQEQLDTTTSGGKLIFYIFASLAEFERDLIRERTNAGLAAARARGRKGGRPKKLKTDGKIAVAQRMFADKANSVQEICTTLGISRATLYRYVKGSPETSQASS